MEGRLAALSYLSTARMALQRAIPLLADKEASNALAASKYITYLYNTVYRQVKDEPQST